MSRCEIRRHAPDQLAQKDFLVRVERLRIESNKIFVSHLPSALVAFHVARSPRRASFPRPDRRRLHASIQSFDRFAPKKNASRKTPTTRCARTRDVASTGTNRYKHIRTLIISDKSWLISAWNANVSVSSLIVCFTSLVRATPFDATSVSGCGFLPFVGVFGVKTRQMCVFSKRVSTAFVLYRWFAFFALYRLVRVYSIEDHKLDSDMWSRQ